MASLDDLQVTLQSIAQALVDQGQAYLKQVPSESSGYLDATQIVQTGFVRVIGVSVMDGSTTGLLHNTDRLASIAGGNAIYSIPTTKGYYPVNLIFTKGLAFVPGTAMKVSLHYSRN